MRQHAIEMNWRHKPIRSPKMLKGHDDHVITCLQFSDNKIVSGSDDNTLKVWSAITGKVSFLKKTVKCVIQIRFLTVFKNVNGTYGGSVVVTNVGQHYHQRQHRSDAKSVGRGDRDVSSHVARTHIHCSVYAFARKQASLSRFLTGRELKGFL